MTVRLPSTDARRAAALRAELDRAGSAMVPGWGVAVGARLVRSGAARDRRPLRRGDVVAARPHGRARRARLLRHARHPAAGTAGRHRHAGLRHRGGAHHRRRSAPLRVQVGATVEDQEVIFETTRALEVSPARIADVVAVDPDTDHIERAPGRVVATEPPARSGRRPFRW